MLNSARPLNSRSLDVGRGLAIVAVMCGHALAPWFMDAGAHFSEPAYLQWKLGASFVMPFFFFLSGVAWRAERSLLVTLRQSMALVLIALLASFAFDFVRVVLTAAGAAPVVGMAPIEPLGLVRHALKMALFGSDYSLSALWFLTALAVARLLAAISLRAGAVGASLSAIALLGLTFTAGSRGWVNFYQVNLIGVAFAFFLAGHAAHGLWVRAAAAPRICAAALVTSGIAIAATFNLNQGCTWDFGSQCGLGWLGGRFGVTMIHGAFGNLPLFAFTAIAGVVFAGAFSILLARFAGAIGGRLARWGGKSLNLLIANSLVLQLISPIVTRDLVPWMPANSIAFFVALLTLVIALNVAAAHLLRSPLRQLLRLASDLAGVLVGLAGKMLAQAIEAAGVARVSQVDADGRAKRGAL